MIGHHYVNEQIAAERGHRLRAEADVHRVARRERGRPSVMLRLARALSHAGKVQSPPVTVTAPVTHPAS
jgi:hypothetical protein